MKVSLNWIKKYVDLPEHLTSKDIAHDLTLRTVEVDSVEDTSEKYNNIVVGKILSVNSHPNADSLRVCMVDVGGNAPVQIVCGGSNLYEGEYVVVSKPGAMVVWHGEGEPVEIKETKMRGESSYGMICGASEVYLDSFFHNEDDHVIVDLEGLDVYPGQNIADVVGMNDTVIEIDNKSLTNRPDLWGHYGIARELAAIYDVPLKPLNEVKIDESLKEYNVEIEVPEKCNRYVALEIDGVYNKKSPLWMQSLLVNAGMRPINAIVDITNYVMLAVGQPTHAFDKTHVIGEKIVVRNALAGENLELLDGNYIEMTTDDLVIADTSNAMCLAGIRGGKKDSILPETTGVLLEVANFSAKTIRKSGKRFDEKTDSSMRYEKGIDTERVDLGVNLALELFKEIFPESKVVSYGEKYPVKTINEEIDVPEEFLNTRLGKVLDKEVIEKVLTNLGYKVSYNNGIYHVIVPTWRSTGDVSLKDDVMGDIARLLSFESFEAKPLTITFDHAVNQKDVSLDRKVREYLSNRCGFNEIFTYPWIDEKYIKASKIDLESAVKLATPPAPELSILRSSLVPGMLESISKNLRYFNEFKLFEVTEVYEKGEYSPSSEDEKLPVHKKMITGCIVGKDAKSLFYQAKGVVERMSEYTHMESFTYEQRVKPTWADNNAYLNIILNDEVIGSIGLVSVYTMNESKIKRVNVSMFEINSNKFIPFDSRTNYYKSLPVLPLIEKDLSLLVDDNITWNDIVKIIKNRVHEIEFIEEYRGDKIPEGKKSITLRVKLLNEDTTMTSDEINKKIDNIVVSLNRVYGIKLREE